MPRQIEVMGQGMVEFPDSMTDDQILSVLSRERMTYMKNFAPGVDKPGLPDSRTLPTPKNFPGFGNPAAEYARRQEPVNRILDGAARMTGSAARRSGGDVADARFGGASDIMRGAAEIAAPLAAVPLAGAGSIGAGAAMLGRMALGAGGGYLGGKLLRAQVPKDQPGLQNFVENVGETAGGLLAGGVSESPKVGAFVKGAAKAAPTAMVRSGPYGMGGVVMHALGHNKLGLAADAVAAAAGLPTVIRGGMAEAAGKPWLGPVFSGILGKNKPQPLTAQQAQGVAAKQEYLRLRGLIDEAPSVIPQGPSPIIPAPTQLPSGRKPGGIWNQDKVLTPAEIIAADAKSKAAIEALKARQAAKQNPRPAPTPKPAAKPTEPSENAAAKMAAQDAAGQQRTGLMNDVAGKKPQGRAADTSTPKAETKTNLMDEAVAAAEAEAAAKKRGAWNTAGGNFFENATDIKQNALIKFANETGKPMRPFSESEYNALVKEFNATKPLHPIDGKPWTLDLAGANYEPGKKAGRDVETTLRHFDNMRLGKK